MNRIITTILFAFIYMINEVNAQVKKSDNLTIEYEILTSDKPVFVANLWIVLNPSLF